MLEKDVLFTACKETRDRLHDTMIYLDKLEQEQEKLSLSVGDRERIEDKIQDMRFEFARLTAIDVFSRDLMQRLSVLGEFERWYYDVSN